MSPDPNSTKDKDVSETVTEPAEFSVYIDDVNAEDENSESSDENLETEYAGYKLLQQDELNNHVDEDDEEEVGQQEKVEEMNFNDKSNDVVLNIDYENLVCSEIDEHPPSQLNEFEVEDDEDTATTAQDFPLSQNQVELVKKAMAGFTLPIPNIPEWAKSLSDDQWNASLQDTIGKLKNP